MKKIYFLSIALLLLPLITLGEGVDITEPSQIVSLFEGIRDWLYTIFLVAVVISFLIAAFYFITAAGNPDKVQKGKDMIKYGVYGIVVALLAGGMTALLKSILALSQGS